MTVNDDGYFTRVVAQPPRLDLLGRLLIFMNMHLHSRQPKKHSIKKEQERKQKKQDDTDFPIVMPVSYPNIGLGNLHNLSKKLF